MSIVDGIAAYKLEEVARAKADVPLAALEQRIASQSPPRGFRDALLAARKQDRYGLIAEIKKASPSKGLIRADFEPPSLARAYEKGGAACLSVLTDTPSFQGKLDYLSAARETSQLPVLRKDFMLDSYQVAEARAYGADCILIILAMVEDGIAHDLLSCATEYRMDTLVEVYNEQELARAMSLDANMIGINNRDLKTFETDLNVTLRLAPSIPQDILVVAESGLSTRADLDRLAEGGITTFLIGESLMRQHDVEAATSALVGARIA